MIVKSSETIIHSINSRDDYINIIISLSDNIPYTTYHYCIIRTTYEDIPVLRNTTSDDIIATRTIDVMLPYNDD
jgi:hypothetical protein